MKIRKTFLVCSERSNDHEAPAFLKRITNVDLLKNMQGKFYAYVAGIPFPTIEWFKNDAKLFGNDRILMSADKNGKITAILTGQKKYECKPTIKLNSIIFYKTV